VFGLAFGVYIHIPYCLQICRYCDFTKYRYDKIMPPVQYTELLRHEIRSRANDVPIKDLSTIYFGGGTPSLFEPSLILSVIDELANVGFRILKGAEVTIEIDPTTVDQEKIETYLRMGVNRFSVGAQTFDAKLLELAGRKHKPEDTKQLLGLLNSYSVNYSFDLLFGLPSQTLMGVANDVAQALAYEPPHISAYCLTVPETHPMAKGRAPDYEQAQMITLIERQLEHAGVLRYEISNFARPGFESKHNLLYWTDQAYWGLGVASHSYFPHYGPWGLRFWNAPSIKLYKNEVQTVLASEPFRFQKSLPAGSLENLELYQALTDFCHTSLRLEAGLRKDAARLKFPMSVLQQIEARLAKLSDEALVRSIDTGWTLTARGRAISNLVFERLTFLKNDVHPTTN
jgi:oxygen-independent coproporphyrinogen-3 oxidase